VCHPSNNDFVTEEDMDDDVMVISFANVSTHWKMSLNVYTKKIHFLEVN
jgi:hypothetical protein